MVAQRPSQVKAKFKSTVLGLFLAAPKERPACYATFVPPLTRETHPTLERAHFNRLSPEHIQHFQRILDNQERDLAQDPEVLAAHNVDWSKRYRGSSNLLLKPRTTEQVASLLSYCHQAK
jgi:D-lactate dehydrogenase (cytochrome)